MTYSEAISSLALLVALASFVVAYLSFRRTSKLDEPNAWMELKAISEPNCWKASIHLKNPTRYPLKLEAVSVPLSRVPIDEKQDFLLAESEAALKLTENESRIGANKHGVGVLYIKMPIPELTVAVGSEGVVQVILVRGSLSVASEATLTCTTGQFSKGLDTERRLFGGEYQRSASRCKYNGLDGNKSLTRGRRAPCRRYLGYPVRSPAD